MMLKEKSIIEQRLLDTIRLYGLGLSLLYAYILPLIGAGIKAACATHEQILKLKSLRLF